LVNTSRKDLNSSREGKPYKGHQGRNNSGTNTSTADPTASNETTGTAEDTYNKIGRNINRRRDFLHQMGRYSRNFREVDNRRSDSSTRVNWNHRRDGNNSSDVNNSRNANNSRDPESLETPLAEKRQKQ
jgi:hypothetical protein